MQLGSGEFTGQPHLEARLAGGALQFDLDGDRIAELTIFTAYPVLPSDLSVYYSYDDHSW